MKYGLIGEHLGHSYSKEVHACLADYDYQITELDAEGVGRLLRSKEFEAINVTIPYKQTVIPYLSEIDLAAKEIGAVNTVVNRGGTLYGYNTDFAGMRALIERHTDSFAGKTVLILGGNGGTAKTAFAVAKALGAERICRVSRTPGEGMLDYETAKRTDARVIINTTPVGMFPKTDGTPIELSDFPHLELVIDAIYNPLRSNLVLEAQRRGIPAEGGLYMLVAQAIYACGHFIGKTFEKSDFERVYSEIRREKENIVLIGMPGSGKSTIGKRIAKRCGLPFFDTDAEIVKETGKEISEIFQADGEKAFRDLESRVIEKLCGNVRGAVIATGGGAVLREENVQALKRDGKLYFLNRSLEHLIPTSDRPLASTGEAIRKRFAERYDIYCNAADRIVDIDENPAHTVREILEDREK